MTNSILLIDTDYKKTIIIHPSVFNFPLLLIKTLNTLNLEESFTNIYIYMTINNYNLFNFRCYGGARGRRRGSPYNFFLRFRIMIVIIPLREFNPFTVFRIVISKGSSKLSRSKTNLNYY